MCFETNCLHQVHELKMEKKKADALTYQMLPPTVARVAINVNYLPIILNSQDYQKTKNLMARQFESVTIYFWCEAFLGKIIARIETFQPSRFHFSDIVGFMVTVEETLPTEVTFPSHLLKSLMFDN